MRIRRYKRLFESYMFPNTAKDWVLKTFGSVQGYLDNYAGDNDTPDIRTDFEKKLLSLGFTCKLWNNKIEPLYTKTIKAYESFKYPIKLYRAIPSSLDDKEMKDVNQVLSNPDVMNSLGTGWTIKPDDRLKNKFVLEAIINEKDIDWDKTLADNFQPDDKIDSDKLQIILKKGNSVQLSKIYNDNDSTDKGYQYKGVV